MCGIAGFFYRNHVITSDAAQAKIQRMCAQIAHRGPDSADYNIFSQDDALVALGHRRLAVVDLTPAGAQPMTSCDGRFTIVYNGEIYGFESLRQRLLDEGYNFQGHSDTEVMLEYMARYGVEQALPLFDGMFAFALWDHHKKTLILARDRTGIKPLYWTNYQGVLGFASELKALYPLWPDGRPPVCREAKILYAQNAYVPAPYTIYENVYKLKPGHVMTLSPGQDVPDIRAYWQWQDKAAAKMDDYTDYAHDVLSESVKITLDADVPVGCFLSGGIDSSLVTALMQSHVTRPVKTFAMGFEDESFNEAPYARAVAQHLGTDHTEMIVGERDMLAVVPMMAQMYDEPFADSSQIPTYLVSKLARQHVTVSLSGDGGDELFLGYNRYRDGIKASRIAAIMPAVARQGLYRGFPQLRSIVGGPSRPASYLRLLASPYYEDLYGRMMNYDTPFCRAVEKQQLEQGAYRTRALGMWSSWEEKARFMRRCDIQRYMVDDVLTKVDRASMAVSLESRVPLLNNRVLDLAASLPLSVMMNKERGKLILRDVLARYLPRPLFERRKMGFGVPMGAWIRGPLKEMVHSHIETAIADDDVFEAGRVRKALSAHIAGQADYSYILWLMSCYGAWKAQQL